MKALRKSAHPQQALLRLATPVSAPLRTAGKSLRDDSSTPLRCAEDNRKGGRAGAIRFSSEGFLLDLIQRLKERPFMKRRMRLGEFVTSYIGKLGVSHLFGIPGDLALKLFFVFGRKHGLKILTLSHE